MSDVGQSVDLAWQWGTYRNTNKDGAVVESGKYLTVFERRGGKWMIVRDMWNADSSAASSASEPTSASKTRALYSVDYGCDPDKVSKARALVERDLNQMRTEDVSDGELHQAKALMLRQIPLSESSEEAVAGGMLARAQIGLPLDEPIRAAKIYVGLTAEQVKAAFARQIRTDNLVQVVRGPAPQ